MLSSLNNELLDFGNLLFSCFKIPSRATAVWALLVANGDLPLNSLLPKLLCRFCTF